VRGSGQEPRGTRALVGVAPRSMPGPLAVRSRRPLRDHIAPWLFWPEHARGLAPLTIVSYGLDAKMFSADLNLIKSLLGHSSITTTAIYAHVTRPSSGRSWRST
jgi:integrase